jgi:hypothetical protein
MSAMRRIAKRSLALALAAILIPAASAAANTLTLGSQFQGTIQPGAFDAAAATVANISLPGSLVASSPTDGTIVDWRFSGDSSPWTPEVVRPVGGGLFTQAGAGPPQNGTGVGNIIGPFPLNLPVKQGDHFGVTAAPGSNVLGIINHPGAVHAYFEPPLQPGPGREPDFIGESGFEEGISATVRYCLVPSLRGKKPKAAKQALKAADCAFGGKSKSKKRRKKKKVVGQSVAPGSSISDTAPVAIKVSRPKR